MTHLEDLTSHSSKNEDLQCSGSDMINTRQSIFPTASNSRPEQSYSINSISTSVLIAKQIHNSYIESNSNKNLSSDDLQTAKKDNSKKVVKTTLSQSGGRLDVRDLLLFERGPKGWLNGQVLRSVEGVVVYKGLLKDDINQIKSRKPFSNSRNNNNYNSNNDNNNDNDNNNNFNNYDNNNNNNISNNHDNNHDNNNKNNNNNNNNNNNSSSDPYEDFRKKQRADYEQNVRYYKKEASNIRKCSVILRDTHRGEIITIYMPVTIASAIMVGFRIVICNSTIHLAENLRTLYLKHSPENNTQIGTFFTLL